MHLVLWADFGGHPHGYPGPSVRILVCVFASVHVSQCANSYITRLEEMPDLILLISMMMSAGMVPKHVQLLNEDWRISYLVGLPQVGQGIADQGAHRH